MIEESLRVRASVVRAFHRGAVTTLVGSDGQIRRFDGPAASLVREILGFFATPRSGGDLLAHLAGPAGSFPPDAERVMELVALLDELRVLIAPAEDPPRPAVGVRLVLGITGAVAAIDAPLLVRLLLERGYELRIAMSRMARRFVRFEPLEVLIHHRVYRHLWDRDSEHPVPHVSLGEWADAVLVYPATATTLSRIAHGDCSEIVPAVCLAAAGPVVLTPSLNGGLAMRPAVRRNLEQLREDGFVLIEPALGLPLSAAPGKRVPVAGPAPPPRTVVDLLDLILREPAGETAGPPRSERAS